MERRCTIAHHDGYSEAAGDWRDAALALLFLALILGGLVTAGLFATSIIF